MHLIDHDQLTRVVTNAESRLAALKEKHPKLKAYLVFFLRGRQAGIRSSGSEILGAIPDMVVDDPAKSAMKSHLKKKPKKEAEESVRAAWNDTLKPLEKKISYNPDARVELRFPNLDYEVIDFLRTDELINQELTPQTLASIRIVLGDLTDLQ